MASYKLSELAENDLRLISVKTIKEWGLVQARTYVSLLHEAMIQLANTPDIGRKRPDLFEGAKSFPAPKHIIFYWNTENSQRVRSKKLY